MAAEYAKLLSHHRSRYHHCHSCGNRVVPRHRAPCGRGWPSQTQSMRNLKHSSTPRAAARAWASSHGIQLAVVAGARGTVAQPAVSMLIASCSRTLARGCRSRTFPIPSGDTPRLNNSWVVEGEESGSERGLRTLATKDFGRSRNEGERKDGDMSWLNLGR